MQRASVSPEEDPQKKSFLLDPLNSEKILRMTADTMFLLSNEGICVDLAINSDRWFLQEKTDFIGKNLFENIPNDTARHLKKNFDNVVATGTTNTDNYELKLSGELYFFKCIMYKYDENHVLCQYRDITQRTMLKKRLETINKNLLDVEKVAQIGQWTYHSQPEEICFSGYSGGFAHGEETHTVGLKEYISHVHPDDIPVFYAYLEKLLKEYSDEYMVFRLIIGKNMFFFRLKTMSCYQEDGNSIISGYVQNITDIMEKQHKLGMVTRAVENSTDYIFAMKTDGQLVFGNKKFKEYHRLFSDEELVTQNFFTLSRFCSGKSRWMDIIEQLTSDNQTIHFVLSKPFPENPDILALDCSAYLIKDIQGADLIWTFGKDITERALYEKQVKELNQIMGNILKNIPMSISVKDVSNNLRYIFSNQCGDEFHWGINNDLIGKTDYELYSKDVADTTRTKDLATIKDKHISRCIVERKDFSGERIIINQLRVMVKDDIRPLLVTIEQDITKDKLMEQELIYAKDKAEESDRLKSAFIANMSHEIRTPLNAIVGFSRIMAETSDNEERMSYYSIIDTNTSRLLSLINEILDISKIEAGIMEFNYVPMKASDLCHEIQQTFSLRSTEMVPIIFEKSDPNIVIRSDKNKLTQIFNNLITNATKFTKEGSIRFGYTEKNYGINFYVKDTGCGIPSDKLNNIFERFFKADSFSQGSGLGLPICKSIVEKMGGSIDVTSKLGVGSCFTFTLPTSCIIKSSEKDKTDSQKAIILIAEDTDSNFALLEAIIGSAYAIIRAKNGLEAINKFEEYCPDLIFMDIKMPVMNGLDATKVIRAITKDVPIVAQSAFAFEEDRKDALESGCNEFLTKPIKKKQLLDIINKYLH